MGGVSVLILLGFLSAMFFVLAALFFAVVIYLVVGYIFESIAIHKMCKNLNYKHCFTAWIPFYNKYLMGKISKSKVEGIIVSIFDAVSFILLGFLYGSSQYNEWVMLTFLILVIISFVLKIVMSHKIFSKALGRYGDIMTIFSVLSLGFLRPIFLFSIRDCKKLYNE